MELIVNTPCGKIQGKESNVENVIVFKGIRYANANRFEYPNIVTSWEGIYDASNYGHCCYQPRSFYDEETNKKKYFYYNEFRKNQKYTYSEDCLFLNIWVNKKTQITDKLPVIVYIHGGGFTGGCGHELHFDGPAWPLNNVIAVTINYRLGPLGFLCFESQKKEIGHTGNYGLYDQFTALKWIKNNIESFGGDSNNITIMGQSAGAMSVQQLCMSPLTKEYISKAVMSSGGGVNKIIKTKKASTYYKLSNKIMELTNCSSMEELIKLDVEKLFEAYNIAKKDYFAMACAPVIDNLLIIDDASKLVKENKYLNIPYMIGSNSEDLASPFMHTMAKKWCKNQLVDSYCYLFAHQLPGDDNGAWHSSDLWYFFNTLDNCWRPITKIDKDLAETMVQYLTNFAKTGDPNSDTLVKWNKANGKGKLVMVFENDTSNMKKVKVSKLWKNMLTKKAVGE